MHGNEREVVALNIARSQQYSNKLSLFFYDALLYGVISTYAWGSSTAGLDAHYARYVTANHQSCMPYSEFSGAGHPADVCSAISLA